MNVDECVRAYADANPECWVPALVRDTCENHSTLFAGLLQQQSIGAEVIGGFQMEGNVILQGHFATLTDGSVIDWTARQFDPAADVPLIMPLTQWRQTWRTL